MKTVATQLNHFLVAFDLKREHFSGEVGERYTIRLLSQGKNHIFM